MTGLRRRRCKRTVVMGNGDHSETVVWASGAARLLPRDLDSRRRGPVFVAKRQPKVLPADRDRCPDTGLVRLSYQMAWKLSSQASDGLTPHQRRHSASTYLGEEGVSAILLQAKSRHLDLRTLARYAKPGIEAMAALTAEHDRGRRHQRSLSCPPVRNTQEVTAIGRAIAGEAIKLSR